MEPHVELIEQLTSAVQRRTTIGIALGMLMERLGLGQDDAFAYLRRCSQAQNRKLYEIAADFAETRRLPSATSQARTAESSRSLSSGRSSATAVFTDR